MQMVDFVLFALDSERDAVRVLYARNSSRALERGVQPYLTLGALSPGPRGLRMRSEI